MKILSKRVNLLLVNAILVSLLGCADVPPMQPGSASNASYTYLLGPGDVIDVFVWRNDELSARGVPVRPDGKISAPLVEDLVAGGKTPKELAREIEINLSKYIKDPFVTVTVREFHGRLDDRIRVVGEVTHPQALPYTENMTLLDVMLAVGGLTEYAAGNRATIIRKDNGTQTQYVVRLEDLIKYGDISANVVMKPGDILTIPQSWF